VHSLEVAYPVGDTTDTHNPSLWSIINFAGGFVGEHEAGQRLFQVAHDPRCAKSGVYWSWNGGPREGRGVEALEKGGQISGGGGAGGGWDSIFENDQSAKVLNLDTCMKLFEYSTKIADAEWPELKQVTSPCPTLNVIGAVTKGMVKREELKRMRELGQPGIIHEEQVKPTVLKKTIAVADQVMEGFLSNSVGRVARFAGKRLLGEIPDEAVQGSFQPKDVSVVVPQEATHFGVVAPEDQQELKEAITRQISKERADGSQHFDSEDEALFEQIYSQETEDQPNGKTSVSV